MTPRSPLNQAPGAPGPNAAEPRAGRPGPRLGLAGVLMLGLSAAFPARAVDGCQVLLCLAAPSWRAIAQCVPPIRQLFRELALGKSFPTCNMTGPGNWASHAWSNPPSFCPPQYIRWQSSDGELVYTCDFQGAISITVNGAPFARTWWTMSGDTSTEFSPWAKSQLGRWDRRFDDDYTAWKQAQAIVDPAAPVAAPD